MSLNFVRSLLIPVVFFVGSSGQNVVWANVAAQYELEYDQVEKRFYLTVHNSPIYEVIAFLEKKLDTKIHTHGIPSVLVNVTCVETTLQRILECLLEPDVNLFIRHNSGQHNESNIPEEIWVLTGSAGYPQHQKTSENPKEIPHVNQDKLSRIIVNTSARIAAQRRQAIADLAHVQLTSRLERTRVRKILEQALYEDEDAEVRAKAISVLMRRFGENASPQLQQALVDNDVIVRMTAMQYVKDESILLHAQSDENADVRQIASMTLKTLERRGAMK